MTSKPSEVDAERVLLEQMQLEIERAEAGGVYVMLRLHQAKEIAALLRALPQTPEAKGGDVNERAQHELASQVEGGVTHPPTNTSPVLSSPSAAPQELSLRRMDTPENRAFWESVEQARKDWERLKPEWARRLESPSAAPQEQKPVAKHDHGRGAPIGDDCDGWCRHIYEVWQRQQSPVAAPSGEAQKEHTPGSVEFCPDCGQAGGMTHGGNLYECTDCGWTWQSLGVRALAASPGIAEKEDDWVFPPSATGGRYSIELSTVGAIMDALKEVACEDDLVATIKRLAASGIASPSEKDGAKPAHDS